MAGQGGVIIRVALEFLRQVRQRPNGHGISGLVNSIGGIASGVAAGANELLLTAAEQVVLTSIRDDARGAGLRLGTVELIPLRLHDRGADLASAEYLAWTNSSGHVFVNVERHQQLVSDLVKAGVSEEQAQRDVRAMAVYTIRHELQHVEQFRANHDQPPATWRQMITFEAASYSTDAHWIDSKRDYLINDIGARPEVVDDIRQSAAETRDRFAGWKGLTDEAGRAAMVRENFIPRQVQGNTNYAVTDLYRTTTP
jgi:hypothetical protein